MRVDDIYPKLTLKSRLELKIIYGLIGLSWEQSKVSDLFVWSWSLSSFIKCLCFAQLVFNFNLDSLQILGIASFRKGNITVYAKLNFLLRMLSNKNTNILNNITSLICIKNVNLACLKIKLMRYQSQSVWHCNNTFCPTGCCFSYESCVGTYISTLHLNLH